MFFRFLLIFEMIISSLSAFSQSHNPPLETVSHLNIPSYMGAWYQIAAIPTSFQNKCAKDTSAFYELMPDGLVQVTNRCVQEDGKESVAHAVARVNPKYSSSSKLEVTFVHIFGFWVWLLSGNYWVIDLDENYSYSVVGDPKREYLWILARKPIMEKEILQKLEYQIRGKNYDTCLVKITQLGDLNQRSLCSISQSLKN